MPELPEVQTIIDDLNEKIIGHRIIGVWFDAPKLIKKPKPKDFKKQIKGLKITEVKRRGKNILIYLKKCQMSGVKCQMFLLLIHQKLTGHLLYGKWEAKNGNVKSLIKGLLEEKVNNYIHLIFYLDNGWQLGLSDLRKFAKVMFGKKEEIEKMPDLSEIGPEPLNRYFNISKFRNIIKKKKGKIKQVLMDQKIIAGIGNIYSDEILWSAEIHPFKKTNELTANELKNLYVAMRQILVKAIKFRGASISDYRDAFGKPGGYAKIRKVYQREGESCSRCQIRIKRVKIGGRSAHFCPKCQSNRE
ncbi:MAG: DNA-formamidopyrimidine glycosylase [Patescibacteria group bacterium]